MKKIIKKVSVKKPAKKMQEGGKVKIKVKIKPDRKQAREDKDKMPLMRSKFDEQMMRLKKSNLDKSVKDAGFKKGGVVKKAQSGAKTEKKSKLTSKDILLDFAVPAIPAMKAYVKGIKDLKEQITPINKKMPKKKAGGNLKKQAAVAIAMKKAGKKPKTMKSGGKMGKCRYGCN